MKPWRAVVAGLLLMVPLLCAQLPGDEPAASDTVRHDSLALWADTTTAFPDSTLPTGIRHAWLYPIGVLAVTCIGFLVLFSARSR
jgi:hypothetical protein